MFSGLRRMTLAVALTCATVPALAEPRQPEDKQAEIEARMKTVLGRLLRREVGLDEERATRVEKALEPFAAERRSLRGELKRARQALRELLRKDSDDQAAYTKALDQYRSAQRKLTALRDREFEAVRRHLTPKQQARYLQALRQVHQRLKRALRDYDAEKEH